MAEQNGATSAEAQGVTEIAVRGFKSLYDETRIAIRPLTLLAGANSSGKSSIMQAVLLLKQTLEAPYDPGPLLLDGPNVQFTSPEQIFSRMGSTSSQDSFSIQCLRREGNGFTSQFQTARNNGIVLSSTTYHRSDSSETLTYNDIGNILPETLSFTFREDDGPQQFQVQAMIESMRCFITKSFMSLDANVTIHNMSYYTRFEFDMIDIVHVPGLRTKPERWQGTAAVRHVFPGLFDKYAASIIHHWQREGDDRLGQLVDALKRLGLTWKVEAKPLDDTRIEVRVGRLPKQGRGSAPEMVSIADVGFGVSQVLPVVVALLAARPGQLVYLEQPELHLHPKAQVALAGVLADAAKRGVHVVAETHSSILLLAIQALVAEEQLDPTKVILHWFERDKRGATKVTSADLDDAGVFGEWPEDFDDVEMKLQTRYLNASSKRLRAR